MPKARAKSKKSIKKKVDPIPKGQHTITPSLIVKGGVQAIEFYKRAFNAKETMRSGVPGSDLIMHAELKLGDSTFMLADEFPQMKCLSPQSIGGTSTSMYVYVKDVDKQFNQAVAAGASAVMQVTDMFWGDRMGQLTDPFGHVWTLASRKRTVSRKEMEKAAQEWASKMSTTQ